MGIPRKVPLILGNPHTVCSSNIFSVFLDKQGETLRAVLQVLSGAAGSLLDWLWQHGREGVQGKGILNPKPPLTSPTPPNSNHAPLISIMWSGEYVHIKLGLQHFIRMCKFLKTRAEAIPQDGLGFEDACPCSCLKALLELGFPLIPKYHNRKIEHPKP